MPAELLEEIQSEADYRIAAAIMRDTYWELGMVELRAMARYNLDGLRDEGVRFLAEEIGIPTLAMTREEMRDAIAAEIKDDQLKLSRVALGAMVLEGFRFAPGCFSAVLRKHGLNRKKLEAELLKRRQD